MEKQTVYLEDLIKKRIQKKISPENIFQIVKNITITPYLIGVVSTLIDRIIQDTKEDETVIDINLQFSSSNCLSRGYYDRFIQN